MSRFLSLVTGMSLPRTGTTPQQSEQFHAVTPPVTGILVHCKPAGISCLSWWQECALHFRAIYCLLANYYAGLIMVSGN
ncbi:hypothetical protein FKM82_028576 [Ascaphus truei]